MRIDRKMFRSKVARRIFILFITCALLPITILAVLSYDRVASQLQRQSEKRLQQAAKAAGMSILERLQFLEAAMKMVATSIAHNPTAPLPPSGEGPAEHLIRQFKAMALTSAQGEYVPLLGHMKDPPSPAEAELQHISSGMTALSSRHDPGGRSRLFMCRALDAREPEGAVLVGEVESEYLWSVVSEESLQPMNEVCVLDPSGEVLYNSLSESPDFPEQEMLHMAGTHSGQFEWNYQDRTYLARYWSLFIKYAYFTPKWIVVMSEAKAHVLAPMANFKRTFPLVVLLALWVVLFLSLNQIRRSLIPLEKLQAGTRRIASRDFETRVSVASGDEFQELAASFNTMAERLGRQFNAMTTMNEIDRSILSALDTEKIVDTVVSRMRELFGCDCVGVALLEEKKARAGLMYIKDDSPKGERRLEHIRLTPSEVQQLHDHPEHLLLDGREEGPQYLANLAGRGLIMRLFLVLPIFLNHNLSGIIVLGYSDLAACSEEDQIHARQLADQVAVALANAQLLEELEELNWGTLYALARTIDAKSPWTAGHSERVTKLALKIGQVLGLNKKELDDMHRAGLLHDIGKLGIPPDILDKPGKLTEQEYEYMRRHPHMGARILEPIAAYEGVMPIVLQHHEYFDGSGYPDGLAGEEIVFGARIFALADHFDALISDRPYRAGMAREEVIEFVKERSGKLFDPKVVSAFLEVTEQEDGESEGEIRYLPLVGAG